MTSANDERAGEFGVEGDAEGPDLRGYDESKTLAYGLARATLTMLPGGELLATLIDHEQQRQVRHARALVDRVAGEAGAETLVSRVQESEEVAAVFRQAVDAAARTGHEAKRRALARIVTMAVLDDAKVDEAALYVLALRDLDAPQLRTLEAMRRAAWKIEQESAERGPDVRPYGPSASERFENSVVAQVKFDTNDVPGVVVAGLVRNGALEPRGTYGSLVPTRPEHYRISGFGHGLLAYLRDTTDDEAGTDRQ